MKKTFINKVSAVWQRELRRVARRPVYFFAPVFILLFCYIFFLTFMKEGLPNALPTGVVDLDNSVVSRTLVRNFDATAQTRIVKHYAGYAEARDGMQRGEIYAFVVIPADFEKKLQSNCQPELTFYVNDAYLIAGSLSLKDLTYMSQLSGASIQKKVLEARGVVDEEQQMAILQPVAVDSHLVANPWANYAVYLLNVLLPGVLQLVVLMITIFSLGMELKERTGPDWMQTASHSLVAALTGKLLPYTILFTALGICGNIVLYRFMHFPMNGSLAWMFLATFLFVLAHQAIGIFLIGLFPVLRDAISLAAFYGLLGFTYAGFTFPIEAMPHNVQVFAHLFPIRHYFLIYVNEALHAADIRYSVIRFAAMAAFLILPLLVIRRFKKAVVLLNFPTK